MNGHETATFAIGNGMLALLGHPREQARLPDRPGPVTTAVEEMLCYDGPVQMRGVVAGHDHEVGATRILAGQALWLAVGATGRDPRQFPEPRRFDVRRAPNRHLQFGVGPHFCHGAALARAEIELALAGLLGRFRQIDVAADRVDWHHIAAFRGPQAVPLTLGH